MVDNEQRQIEQFKSWHDEAYLYINQAVTQEKPEISRPDVALMMYRKGLSVLDMALCVDTESGPASTWEKSKKMQQKMVKTRSHVEMRISELTNSEVSQPPPRPPPPNLSTSQSSSVATGNMVPARPPLPNSVPPAYEDVISGKHPSAPPPPPPYTQDDIIDLTTDSPAGPLQSSSQLRRSATSDSIRSSEEGELLFSLEDVQVFHVSASGEVTTPSYPETLHLVKFERERNKNGEELPPAFIEVGEWTYPLMRGRSPILKSDYGGYMFPDLDDDNAGGAVGIIIPDTISDTDREIFESILAEITTAFKTQAEVEEDYARYKDFSSTLSSGLVKGAEVVGQGMVKGAVATGEYLCSGSEYVKQYITPEATARPVDPKLRSRLETARWVSNGACRVSGWMVSKVGLATMALGRLVAPHIERGATRALTSLTNKSTNEASSQLAIVGEIASGTVAAASTVYLALENSSKILAKNMADSTVKIVSHKYGQDMAAATDAALATAGNSYLTFYNAAALGPKGIAKRAVKDTAKIAIGVDPTEVDKMEQRIKGSEK